jgi:hypothetical protein
MVKYYVSNWDGYVSDTISSPETAADPVITGLQIITVAYRPT